MLRLLAWARALIFAWSSSGICRISMWIISICYRTYGTLIAWRSYESTPHNFARLLDLNPRNCVEIQRLVAAQHSMKGQLGELEERLQVGNAVQVVAGEALLLGV